MTFITNNTAKGIAVLVGLVLILLSPFFTIWALNTLFPVLDIPFSANTWSAVLILGGALKFKN